MLENLILWIMGGYILGHLVGLLLFLLLWLCYAFGGAVDRWEDDARQQLEGMQAEQAAQRRRYMEAMKDAELT